MAFTVSQFKTKLAEFGGAARPNLFKVKINPIGEISNLGFSDENTILIKATSIPAITIAEIAVNYVGRPIKYTGNRTYDNWTTTVINDEHFSTRDKIMQWMRKLSGTMEGERTQGFGVYATPAGQYLEATATVTQINKDGKDGESYQLDHIWPTVLSPIPVSWDADTIQEYTIDWCFDTIKHN